MEKKSILGLGFHQIKRQLNRLLERLWNVAQIDNEIPVALSSLGQIGTEGGEGLSVDLVYQEEASPDISWQVWDAVTVLDRA